MVTFDLTELRKKLDLEGKYVDFQSIRTALTVLLLAEDVKTILKEPNTDGETRGDCPKCNKRKSFALNINTNKFNCFNTGCDLKGGGVIDFASKLFETTAKEASHLLACAYGIQPYTAEFSGGGKTASSKFSTEVTAESGEVGKIQKPGEYVLLSDYQELETKLDDLRKEFNEFRNVVYEYMIEDENHQISDYESGETESLVSH